MNESAARSISRDDHIPLYHQLKQILLKQILTGAIQPGDTLPSERELQESYKVSQTTVRRAVNDLAAAGYLVRQSGRGTFVLQRKVLHAGGKIGGFIDDLRLHGFEVNSQILETGYKPVPIDVAQKLNFHEAQELFVRKVLVFANGEPIAFGTAYHNLGIDVDPTSAEMKHTAFLTLLHDKYGVTFNKAERTTEAVAASEEEARLLGVKPGAPLLHVELLIRDQQEKAIYLVKSLYRGDRYKYCEVINT